MQTQNWKSIRAHYKMHDKQIIDSGRNEWGIDAYAWDGLLTLTPIEFDLWEDIRLLNMVFYPQYPVGQYFVDFGNPAAKIAIEADGHAYHLDKAKDLERDISLAAMGWKTYRIPGAHCIDEYDEETGDMGRAYTFIKNIGVENGLIRNGGDGQSSRGWVSFGVAA